MTNGIAPVMPRVLQLLHPYELQFLELIERFTRVWAYDVELRAATRSKRFVMRNSELWDVILADRDMFVLDFASWLTSLAGTSHPRSFLDALTADDLSEFGLEAGPAADAEDSHLAAYDWNRRVEAFSRLFPARIGPGKRWPEKADIRALKVTLTTLTKGLEKQRDARAHIYDGKDFETVQNLGFEEIAKVFHRAREVLHDVRLLVDHSSHDFPPVKEPKGDRTARDIESRAARRSSAATTPRERSPSSTLTSAASRGSTPSPSAAT
jgi:hypothetical protein